MSKTTELNYATQTAMKDLMTRVLPELSHPRWAKKIEEYAVNSFMRITDLMTAFLESDYDLPEVCREELARINDSLLKFYGNN